MTGKTKIEWTDKSWNPIVGCSVVSPGCTNCYAMRFAGARLQHTPGGMHYIGLTTKSKAGPVWTGKLAIAPEKTLLAPLRWQKPAMIFVNSMGDLFHENVPDEWIDRVFAVMAMCRQHVFQVLTKRADRMRVYCSKPERMFDIAAASQEWPAFQDAIQGIPIFERTITGRCFPNVWLGVSAEDQKRADERIPALLDTPAAVRFVSAEPLLGPIDFERILYQRKVYQSAAHHYIDVLRGGFWSPMGPGYRPSQDGEPKNHFTNHSDIKDRLLNWIIVGGESGRDARPMHPDWARSIRDQCAAAGVPFFFKQWGEWLPISEMSEDQTRSVYRSNRIAKSGEDQDELDDVYGTTCKVRQICLRIDGCHVDMESPNAFLQGTKPMQAFCVGKAQAGRLLDGMTHDGMPRIAAHGDAELAL